MDYYTSVIILCWLSLAVLCILVWENDRFGAKEKKQFYITYALVACAALAEWLGTRLNGNASVPGWAVVAVKCADYILTPAAGAAFVMHLKGFSIWKKLMCWILGFNTVFQIISAFTGWMVTLDAQNRYSHGPLYSAYIVIYVVIIILIITEFVTFGRNFRKQNRASLFAVMLTVAVSILMQEGLGSSHRTAYLGLTLGMAMLYIHIVAFSQLTSDDTIQEQKVVITTDAMTGAASRYAYIEALAAYDAMGTLPDDLTVFSIDVNGLKTVNDSIGHEAGDELICGASDCIRKAFASSGTCYRTGGDEFIVLARMDAPQAQDALAVLKETAAAWHGSFVDSVHLAAGFACAADHPGLQAEKLVAVADKAMYADKSAYYRASGHDRRRRSGD